MAHPPRELDTPGTSNLPSWPCASKWPMSFSDVMGVIMIAQIISLRVASVTPWLAAPEWEKAVTKRCAAMEEMAKDPAGAMKALQEEVWEIAPIAFQNGMALDMKLAAEGRVCAVVDTSCCVYVEQSGRISTDICVKKNKRTHPILLMSSRNFTPSMKLKTFGIRWRPGFLVYSSGLRSSSLDAFLLFLCDHSNPFYLCSFCFKVQRGKVGLSFSSVCNFPYGQLFSCGNRPHGDLLELAIIQLRNVFFIY